MTLALRNGEDSNPRLASPLLGCRSLSQRYALDCSRTSFDHVGRPVSTRPQVVWRLKLALRNGEGSHLCPASTLLGCRSLAFPVLLMTPLSAIGPPEASLSTTQN